MLLKRLGQDFIFLCQIFLTSLLRRKLKKRISFELSFSSTGPNLSPYPGFLHCLSYIIYFFSFFFLTSSICLPLKTPCSYFLRNYFLVYLSVSICNFVYFICEGFIVFCYILMLSVFELTYRPLLNSLHLAFYCNSFSLQFCFF